MASPYSETKDGYEVQLGTNHMGHALLTKLLMPTLLRTAEESNSDVRIVNLSSEGHEFARFSKGVIYDQSKASSYGTWTRYGSAKLANILHVRGLQKHYPQITATSVHPGVVGTDLFNSFKESNATIGWLLNGVSGFFMKTVAQGAQSQLWACAAPKAEVKKGYYFTPVGKKSSGNWYAKNDKAVNECWTWTEAQLERHGA